MNTVDDGDVIFEEELIDDRNGRLDRPESQNSQDAY